MCHAEIIEKCVFYPLLVKWHELEKTYLIVAYKVAS